jgi:maltooligosyltrehalose synthase
VVGVYDCINSVLRTMPVPSFGNLIHDCGNTFVSGLFHNLLKVVEMQTYNLVSWRFIAVQNWRLFLEIFGDDGK